MKKLILSLMAGLLMGGLMSCQSESPPVTSSNAPSPAAVGSIPAAGAAPQSTVLVISCTFTVAVTLPAGIRAYQDAGCTIPLTTLDYGSIDAGTNKSQSFRLKNVGDVTLELSTATGTTPGYNAAVLPGQFPLVAGGVQEVTVEVQLPVGFAEGDYSFSVYIN